MHIARAVALPLSGLCVVQTGPMRIVFVCLGNICRSPAAEAIFAAQAQQAGLDVEIESAGTGSWHIGEQPHQGARQEARSRDIPVDHLGQQFTSSDFGRFDVVVAMDSSNVSDLLDLAPDQESRDKVVRMGQFAPDVQRTGVLDVPDPYGKPQQAFSAMFDQLEPAAAGLVAAIQDGSVAGRASVGDDR